MPKTNHILNLPGFTIKSISKYSPAIVEAVYHRKARCLYCGNKKLRKKDSFLREVKHQLLGIKPMVLRFKAYKFYCPHCQRYFNQRFPGILKHQRATEKLKEQVFHYHNRGVSQKDLAKDIHVGHSTIERWYHKGYVKKNQTILHRHCPTVLGIDEHSFSKKQGYATTFCDLRKHRVFDIVKGRSAKSLNTFLSQLPGKHRVKVICIDLSCSYKSIVKKYFPNAKIVSDRFHVIRLMNYHFLKAYQKIDPDIKYGRKLLGCLRTNPENLSAKQVLARECYLNDNHAIRIIYEFKQQLHQFLMKKTQTKKQCQRLITMLLPMIQLLQNSALESLKTFGNTLDEWQEEIVRMWRLKNEINTKTRLRL